MRKRIEENGVQQQLVRFHEFHWDNNSTPKLFDNLTLLIQKIHKSTVNEVYYVWYLSMLFQKSYQFHLHYLSYWLLQCKVTFFRNRYLSKDFFLDLIISDYPIQDLGRLLNNFQTSVNG